VTSAPYDANTSPDVTTVARDLIASFGQDPGLYVPGTVSTLPGTRTTTYDLACGTRCPHQDRRCHRTHAAWLNDEPLHALLNAAARTEDRRGTRVPAQRRRA
jgi:hypothetical protein